MTRTNDPITNFSQRRTQTGIQVTASEQRLVRQLLADDTVRADISRAGQRCSQSGLYARALAVYADQIAADRSPYDAHDPAALANQIAALSAALALALNAANPAPKPRKTDPAQEKSAKLPKIEPENAEKIPVPDPNSALAHGRPMPGPAIANPFAPAPVVMPKNLAPKSQGQSALSESRNADTDT